MAKIHTEMLKNKKTICLAIIDSPMFFCIVTFMKTYTVVDIMTSYIINDLWYTTQKAGVLWDEELTVIVLALVTIWGIINRLSDPLWMLSGTYIVIYRPIYEYVGPWYVWCMSMSIFFKKLPVNNWAVVGGDTKSEKEGKEDACPFKIKHL